MCYDKILIEHYSSPGFSSMTNVNTAIKAAKPVSRTVCVPNTWAPTSAGLSRALVRRLWGYHRASLACCTEYWRWGWWRRHGCRKWHRMVVVTAEMTDRIGQATRGQKLGPLQERINRIARLKYMVSIFVILEPNSDVISTCATRKWQIIYF